MRKQISDLEQQKEKLADPVYVAHRRASGSASMPGDIPYQSAAAGVRCAGGARRRTCRDGEELHPLVHVTVVTPWPTLRTARLPGAPEPAPPGAPVPDAPAAPVPAGG